MNILFVIPSLAKGGQEKAGMFLCNYLMEFHIVTVVCFEKRNEADFNYQCPIVRIYKNSTFFSKFETYFYRYKELKKVKKELQPDCSIAFGNTAIIFNSLTSCNEKTFSSIRQSFYKQIGLKNINAKIHNFFYLRGIKKSTKIVPVSNAINLELKKYFNINNQLYINNGYDIDNIQLKAKETCFCFKENRFYFIHVGRFGPPKGHWHLIRIFSEIRKRDTKVRLLLLGGIDHSSNVSNAINEYCKKYLEKNNISWSYNETDDADVLFLGHQINPYKYIARSHLFVFPSIWEGFPNALAEAMSCGIPVVSADFPTGSKDLLLNETSDESYGLILPAFVDDFTSETPYRMDEMDKIWSEKIMELINDNEKLCFYKEQALKRSKQFTVQKMGNTWNKLISNSI